MIWTSCLQREFHKCSLHVPRTTPCLPLTFCISYCRQMPLGIHILPKSIIWKTIENDKLLLLPSLHGAYATPCPNH